MPAGILFVIGASGSGKTSAVKALGRRELDGVSVHHFDDIGVPSPSEMRREFGSGEAWQAHATMQWVQRLAVESRGPNIDVLDGQTRPGFIHSALENAPIETARIVLLDCRPEVRAARLGGPRGRPELASARMERWAAYLRAEADRLGLPVVETSDVSVEVIADLLQTEVERMKAQVELGR